MMAISKKTEKHLQYTFYSLSAEIKHRATLSTSDLGSTDKVIRFEHYFTCSLPQTLVVETQSYFIDALRVCYYKVETVLVIHDGSQTSNTHVDVISVEQIRQYHAHAEIH